jgi:homeobox-leucine zipper protein
LQVPGRNGMASTDTSSDSVITVGLPQNPTPQHSPRDVNSAGRLLALAEDTLTEFLAKATGTAVDWIQLPGMKVYIYISTFKIYCISNHLCYGVV